MKFRELTNEEMVAALRRAEVGWRTGFTGGWIITPNLDMADLVRQMADAYEATGGIPLGCMMPGRGNHLESSRDM